MSAPGGPDRVRTEVEGTADSAVADAGRAVDENAGAGSLPGEALTEQELEGLLFVAERPLTRRELTQVTGASREVIDARLGDLEVSLRSRGIRLLTADDAVELATAPEAGRVVSRWVGAAATRVSPAALETLAVVAYRQPVTRAVIERIRGVDSEYALRLLLHRRLVVETGRADAPGRPILYGTSFEFLERFGLSSLDDLPPLDADAAGHLVEEDVPSRRPAGSQATPGYPADDA